jgi:type IV secretory pathway VirB2 component (pilin)
MTRDQVQSSLPIALGLTLLLVTGAEAAAEVDPADIYPLANTLGWILAVPVARLFGVGLLVLACVAVARGREGTALVLCVFAGVVFLGPDAVTRIIGHAAHLASAAGP